MPKYMTLDDVEVDAVEKEVVRENGEGEQLSLYLWEITFPDGTVKECFDDTFVQQFNPVEA